MMGSWGALWSAVGQGGCCGVRGSLLRPAVANPGGLGWAGKALPCGPAPHFGSKTGAPYCGLSTGSGVNTSLLCPCPLESSWFSQVPVSLWPLPLHPNPLSADQVLG